MTSATSTGRTPRSVMRLELADESKPEESPEIRERVLDHRRIDARTRGAVMDRHFSDRHASAVSFHFRLEEMSARTNPPCQHLFKRSSREQLIAARHVAKTRAEEQIRDDRAAATQNSAFPRRLADLPAATKPAA